MNSKFSKPKTNEIDVDSITLECVDQQITSMQLGYISHCFIVKGMEDDFDLFYKANFDEHSEEVIAAAEVHALKHLEDPNYLTGDVLKNIPKNVNQCIQGLIMIKNKNDEIASNSSKAEVMKRNVAWLKELKVKMVTDKKENTDSTAGDVV